jgi:hypothetical protein
MDRSAPIAREMPPLRYRRPVRPLLFRSEEPEAEKVGETIRHLKLRTFLFQLLEHALGHEDTVGSDQYVYWNARDPRRTCAPDAFVKLNASRAEFDVWKTWERGAPELVVEIGGKSDREPLTWEEKYERFHEMGTREVVRFDGKLPAGARLKAWDRIEDDLVEREVEGDATPCLTLGLWWVVRPVEGFEAGLRLARDAAGTDLVLSVVEESERRIAELEAALRARP